MFLYVGGVVLALAVFLCEGYHLIFKSVSLVRKNTKKRVCCAFKSLMKPEIVLHYSAVVGVRVSGFHGFFKNCQRKELTHYKSNAAMQHRMMNTIND